MLILQIPIQYPAFILAFSPLSLFVTPFSNSEKLGSHNPHFIYLFSQSQYTPNITSKYLTHTPVINKFTISSTRSVYNSFVMLNLQYIAKILFFKVIRLVLPTPLSVWLLLICITVRLNCCFVFHLSFPTAWWNLITMNTFCLKPQTKTDICHHLFYSALQQRSQLI